MLLRRQERIVYVSDDLQYTIIKGIFKGAIVMDLNDWFEKGISPASYQQDLEKHRADFFHVYEQFEIPVEDQEFLQRKSHIRVIALAEVWCGHCMVDVPIMQRIAETAGMDISMLPRDEHLELMDQYTTDGKRVIPIFIFIDENGNEITNWGPMAPEVRKITEQAKEEANVPKDKSDPQYKAAFKTFAEKVSRRFATDSKLWQHIYQDIVQQLP